MKERLLEFLRNENKSSAQLAEEIGVQASGISHILSGRNNPSLDFILKMLDKYDFLSTDWLLFGRGSMYKDSKMQTLFDDTIDNSKKDNELPFGTGQIGPELAFKDVLKARKSLDDSRPPEKSLPEVVKIVWFYDNNSFDEFVPRR